jgi:adenosine deaminase
VLRVERIDHGVQAGQRRCADAAAGQGPRAAHGVPAVQPETLCVSPTWRPTTWALLLDAGLVATVNSDDPAYFGGYMNDNFTQTFAATGLQAQHAYTLARNSFEASFLDASAKRALVDRLDQAFAMA